jgi:hypothetical protein
MRHHDAHLTGEDLLRAADHELSARQQSLAEAHLARCTTCRAALDRIEGVTSLVADTYRRALRADGVAESRQLLHVSLANAVRELNGSWKWRLDRTLSGTPAWALIAVLFATSLLAMDLLSGSHQTRVQVAAVEHGALPIASFTPGATLAVGTAELCDDDRRPRQHRLPGTVRDAVLRRYGMEHVPETEYELDFLITPELGGAADEANLWPERYALPTWNARVKDQLEGLLPGLVCNGTVPLEIAQRDIASDWIAAYKRYFNTSLPVAPAQFSTDRSERDEIVFEDVLSPMMVAALIPSPIWGDALSRR